MKRLVILAYGDNVPMHEQTLAEAAKLVADLNNAPVKAVWVEDAHDDD